MKIVKNKNQKNKIFKIANKEKKYFENFHLLRNGDEIIESPKSKLSASQAVENGKYRLYVSSNTKELFSNIYNNNCEALILGDGGDFASINYHNGKFASTDHTLTIKYKEQNNLYMYYYWKKNIKNIDHCFQGTKLKNLKKPFFRDMKIGIHKDVNQQEKIAKVLSQQEEQVNNIQKLIEKLEKRNQYYAERLLSGELRVREDKEGNIEFYENEEWKEVKIGNKVKNIPNNWKYSQIKDLASVVTGKKNANAGSTKGIYKFFTCSKEDKLINSYSFDQEAILIAGNGVVGLSKYYNGKFDAYQRTYVLGDFKINAKYLFSFINEKFQKAIEKDIKGGVISYIKLENINEFEVLYPNNEKELDLLINALSNLKEEQSKVEIALNKEQKRFEWLSNVLLSGEYQIVD